MSDKIVTDEGTCGKCGAHVESVRAEPADVAPSVSGTHMVILSTWTILSPCGCAYKRATGASLND